MQKALLVVRVDKCVGRKWHLYMPSYSTVPARHRVCGEFGEAIYWLDDDIRLRRRARDEAVAMHDMRMRYSRGDV